MREAKSDISIRALHLTVGVVALAGALGLAFSEEAIEGFACRGLPEWVRLALAWSEIVAAILFLIPRTLTVGGPLLLLVFFGAALVHIAHGEFNIGALVVYAVAVIVVMTHRKRMKEGVTAV